MILHTKRLGNSGSHLIMLHGWGQSLEALRPLGELLSSSAQVHLIDLPGFGKTPIPSEVWGVEEYAHSIISYMDQHQIEQADILGHSFGGRLALVLGAQYPKRVKKITLINSAGIEVQETRQQNLKRRSLGFLRALTRKADRVLGTDFYQEYFIPTFASHDYREAGDMRSIFLKVIKQELSYYAVKVGAPTLMLWGEDDQETPVEQGYRLHKLLANSKLLTFKGRGHFLFAGAGAHLCAYHILPFLSEESVLCLK
ncbi:MAG: alpha/beta fold hydrolase [Chlamydiota bacterium]